jgi:putative tryptophan/tyrosine transport system substrate-binding protein
MRRIGLVLALGLAFAPVSVAAQSPTVAGTKQVGWLGLVPLPRLMAEFERGMRELGYVEGTSYALVALYAGDKPETLQSLAAELVGRKPDVIVGEAFQAAQALQRTTKTIPIVFISGDPVTSGFVQSLAHPGGNLTGVANLSLELYPKRVEVLRAAIPNIRRMAVLIGPTVRPKVMVKTLKEAANTQGIEAAPISFVNRAEDLGSAFASASRAKANAILITANPFFNAHRDRVVALAAQHRLPALYEFRDFVEAGGLICYGADNRDVYHRAATYVDRILKGAKPADLPVEQPTKFELMINLKTAKALGLKIPQSLLLRADQVIE